MSGARYVWRPMIPKRPLICSYRLNRHAPARRLAFDAAGKPTVMSLVSNEDASLRADLASQAATFGDNSGGHRRGRKRDAPAGSTSLTLTYRADTSIATAPTPIPGTTDMAQAAQDAVNSGHPFFFPPDSDGNRKWHNHHTGRSFGLKLDKEADRVQIIMDGNLAKFESGKKKIDQALAAGKQVDINYVHRDPLEAFINGAIKRAVRQVEEFGTGRTVPLKTHVGTHVGANMTIRKLAKEYADEPRVIIAAANNSKGRGKAVLFDSVEDIPTIDEQKLLADVEAALDEALQNGTITQEIYEGFTASAVAAGHRNTRTRSTRTCGQKQSRRRR